MNIVEVIRALAQVHRDQEVKIRAPYSNDARADWDLCGVIQETGHVALADYGTCDSRTITFEANPYSGDAAILRLAADVLSKYKPGLSSARSVLYDVARQVEGLAGQ